MWYIIGCLYEPVRWQLEGKGNFSLVMFLLEGVLEKNLWFYRRGETYKNKFYGCMQLIACYLQSWFLFVPLIT